MFYFRLLLDYHAVVTLFCMYMSDVCIVDMLVISFYAVCSFSKVCTCGPFALFLLLFMLVCCVTFV
jgi:hypothetical protein